MLKIEFEEPTHGWLPVKMTLNDIEECFKASDIPLNPISQLEDALFSAITGNGDEVWWHLEPGGYYLNIHRENHNYRLKLEYSPDSKKQSREDVFDITGSFKEIIVPIWRSLRSLQSMGYSEFKVSDKVMESITNRVKAEKMANKIINETPGGTRY